MEYIRLPIFNFLVGFYLMTNIYLFMADFRDST